MTRTPADASTIKDTIRIGIIGAGPRGLWAVEELVKQTKTRSLAFDITVFDPQEPGYGSAYNTAQAPYLLMNATAHTIYTGMSTLNDFRHRMLGERHPLSDFPPRATVGKFLQTSWKDISTKLPTGSSLTFIKEKVEYPDQLKDFDHCLIVTGHRTAQHPAGMLDPFTDLHRIEANSSVTIRGAALTSIDTVLSLTLGRDGHIENGRYIPSGKEPKHIYPTSRSGRFIQVKPSPATDNEQKILTPYRERIPALTSAEELKDLLAQAASAILGAPFHWDCLHPAPDALVELRRSLAEPRRPQQVIGLVWRELYRPIIRRFSLSPLATTSTYKTLVATLKPYAFGSPAEQLERILAIAEAGILSLSHLTQNINTDYTVDAVLAPAGIHPGTLEARILEGIAPDQVPTGSPRPLETDPYGFVAGQLRFAFAGRITEPYVLGNDSLSRELHTIIPQWAQKIGQLYAP